MRTFTYNSLRSLYLTALGAGASKAEGAPLQGDLFRDYFSSPTFRSSRSKMDRELTSFFAEMFHIDVKHGDLTETTFPTFEEVLGLTDLAIMRKVCAALQKSPSADCTSNCWEAQTDCMNRHYSCAHLRRSPAPSVLTSRCAVCINPTTCSGGKLVLSRAGEA